MMVADNPGDEGLTMLKIVMRRRFDRSKVCCGGSGV